MKWGVYNSENILVMEFNTPEQAYAYKELNGNSNWRVSINPYRPSTIKQRNLAHFIERKLRIKAVGIERFQECSDFIKNYIHLARAI